MLRLFVESPDQKVASGRFEVVRRLTPDEAVVEKRKKANESWRIAHKAPSWKSGHNNRLSIEQSQLKN